jgi:hypothetical protein
MVPPPENGTNPVIAELTRQLQDVLTRFENLSVKMDERFVQKENFIVWQRLFDETIHGIRDSIRILGETKSTHADKEDLARIETFVETRASKTEVATLRTEVDALKDDKKWLQRTIYGFLIIAVLGLLVYNKIPGGG